MADENQAPVSLAAGSPAPAFTLPGRSGNMVSLSDYAGKNDVLVFFYPKDDTPGCTKEACSLRDSWKDLQDAGVVVLGVSRDDAASHAAFTAKYNLPFELLTDADHAVHAAYGSWEGDRVLRKSFLVGKDGKLKHVFDMVDTARHAEQVLTAMGIPPKPAPAPPAVVAGLTAATPAITTPAAAAPALAAKPAAAKPAPAPAPAPERSGGAEATKPVKPAPAAPAVPKASTVVAPPPVPAAKPGSKAASKTKAPAKKAPAKKAPAKKAVAKRAPAKRAPAKKAPAKKKPAKKRAVVKPMKKAKATKATRTKRAPARRTKKAKPAKRSAKASRAAKKKR